MERAKLLDSAENVSADDDLSALGARPSSTTTAHSQSKPGRKSSAKIFHSMTRGLRRAINDTTKPRSRVNNKGIQAAQRPSKFGKGNHTYEQVAEQDNAIESVSEPVVESQEKHHSDEIVKVAAAETAAVEAAAAEAIHKQQLLEKKAHETKMKAIHGHRDRKDLSMPDLDEAHVRLRAEMKFLKTHAWFTDATQQAVKDFDHVRHEIALMLHHQLTYHLSDEIENLHQAIKRLNSELIHGMITAAHHNRLMDFVRTPAQKALLDMLWNIRDSMYGLWYNLNVLMQHGEHISTRKAHGSPDTHNSKAAQRLQHTTIDLGHCLTLLEDAGLEFAEMLTTLLKCASADSHPGDFMTRLLTCLVWSINGTYGQVQEWLKTVQNNFHFQSLKHLALNNRTDAWWLNFYFLTIIATRSTTGSYLHDENDRYPRQLYEACWNLVLESAQAHHLGSRFYKECGKIMSMVFSDEAWVDLHASRAHGTSPNVVQNFTTRPVLRYQTDDFSTLVGLRTKSDMKSSEIASHAKVLANQKSNGCFHKGLWIVPLGSKCHDIHSVELWFA